jgi:hypothetical protein
LFVKRLLQLSALIFVSAISFHTASAAQIQMPTHGCQSQADAENLENILKSSNFDKYQRELGRRRRVGVCRMWAMGENVSVKDRDDTLVCLAAKSGGICYWSSLRSIE